MVSSMLLCMCVCYCAKDGWIKQKGEKRFSPSKRKKIGKKCCGLRFRAAFITRHFFKTQNPRLINESGFKLSAAYDGARTVVVAILANSST